MIRDLSRLLKPEAMKAGEALYLKWQQNWIILSSDKHVEANISDQITQTKASLTRGITNNDPHSYCKS